MQTDPDGERLLEREGLTVEVLGGREGAQAAVRFLDAAEEAAGAPLVDEAERLRLEALSSGEVDHLPHWHGLLARRRERAAGYAGLTVPDTEAAGDLAVDRDDDRCSDVTFALFEALRGVAGRHHDGRLIVWVRHATEADEACARSAGFDVARRLEVMGRPLHGLLATDLPDGLHLRSFEPGRDDEEVVAVLRGAYAGTPDGGWDRDRFRERQALPWFRPEDLLIAERDDTVVGLHWTKRRGDGTGEVYNLAVAPSAQGSGLGRVLLRAGLEHLESVGCDEVILWVDRANEAGVALYRSEGFSTRWVDASFAAEVGGQP